MSQVKFIQLGTTAEPKKNYVVDGNNEYITDLQSAINGYPGAVIFTTFVKSVGGKPKNEIYANGQLYSAGGSGSGSVYYGTDQVENGLISNWNNSHPGEEPERGSIYIYTPNSETTGEDIANRTAYYFECTEGQESQGKWIAFTGNVNAENVWFPNGIDRTEAFGWKSVQNDVSTECTNLNLKDALEFYLVKAKFPNVTANYANQSAPTWSISSNTMPSLVVYNDETYQTQASSGATVEVGTKYYVNQISYTPSITCKHSSENTSLASGATKTFTIGPSSLTGLNYGFWSTKGESNGANEQDRFTNSTVVFNGEELVNTAGTKYTPTSTIKTASIEYTYTNTNNSTLNLNEKNFTDSNGTKSISQTGDSALILGSRTLTTSLGTNTISLSITNSNYWSRAFSNNTIPVSDYIYAASNKYTDKDFENSTKQCQVAAKTVGTNEDKKVENAQPVSKGSFTVTGVYKIYINGIAQNIQTYNSSNIAGKQFTKGLDTKTAWTIEVPTVTVGSLKIQTYVNGQWNDHKVVETSTTTHTDASGASVSYKKFSVNLSDGEDAIYRLN